MLDLVIVTFLGVWLLATVLRHLPKRLLPQTLRDVLSNGVTSWLVPSWTFFAPRPGIYTYHLVYRDIDEVGEVGAWHEVRTPASTAWWCALWNPQKTLKKALIDMTMELVRVMKLHHDEPELIKISMPYLSLLTYVTQQPRLTLPEFTQFALLQSTAGRFDTIFLSALHRLDG